MNIKKNKNDELEEYLRINYVCKSSGIKNFCNLMFHVHKQLYVFSESQILSDDYLYHSVFLNNVKSSLLDEENLEKISYNNYDIQKEFMIIGRFHSDHIFRERILDLYFYKVAPYLKSKKTDRNVEFTLKKEGLLFELGRAVHSENYNLASEIKKKLTRLYLGH